MIKTYNEVTKQYEFPPLRQSPTITSIEKRLAELEVKFNALINKVRIIDSNSKQF